MSEKVAALENKQPKGLVWLGWVVVIVLAIGPRMFDLDIFYARDELAIWPWADQFTLAVWAGDPAGTLTTSDYPGIPLFWTQTLFLSFKYTFPALFPQTVLPVEQLTTDRSLPLLAERRLAAALLVGLQVIAAVWLVRRLFGWPSALLAAVLLGLDPFSLSEARLLRLEMISALFVALSVLSYLLYLRRRRPVFLLLSGAMAGLGVSAKTSAGLVVPYIWLLLALDFLFGPSQTWRQKIQHLLVNGPIWAGGAIAAFWLIWPAMWVKPLAALQYVFLTGFSQAANRSVWGEKVFFLGRVVDGGDPGPLFYPVALAFRTTPLVWMGTACALFFLAIVVWRKLTNRPAVRLSENEVETDPSLLWGWPWLAVAVGLLLLYAVIVGIELSLVISKVDRFLLLIFPELNILSALGLAGLITWIINSASQFRVRLNHELPLRFHLMAQPMTIVLIFVILIIQLAITLPVHPYFFTYWNPWAGGGQAAMELLPIGAGEGMDLAMNFLNEQPGAASKTVICGASQPWCSRIFEGNTVRSADYVDGRWVQADYATFYISQLQRQIDPVEVVNFFKRQKPLYQVDLQGVDYVWVYPVPKIDHFAGRSNDLAGLGRLLGYNLNGPALLPDGEVSAKPGETVEAKIWWTNFGAGVNNLVIRWVDETGYEWGRAKVNPLLQYAGIAPAERAVAVGTASLNIPPGTPPGLYFWRMGITGPGEDRLLGEFNLPGDADKLVVVPGPVLPNSNSLRVTNELNKMLVPEVRLVGYDPPAQTLTPTAPTWLALYWQAVAPPPNYQITLRLVNSAGREVTRWAGQPAHGRYPTENWRVGELIKDVWALQVPAGTPTGSYDLEISLAPPDQPHLPNQTAKIHNLEVLPQPVRYEAPDMQHELKANFGEHLTLLGYDLYFDTGDTAGGALAPVFYWQSQADFTGTFDLLLTLRAADTAQVVKEWRVPLGGSEAKALWKAAEIVETGYRLETGDLAKGHYHLDLSLEDHTSGQIEPVKQGDGPETTFARLENVQEKIVVRVGRP